jgi:hypothetical protein
VRQALYAATMGGARCLGRAGEIGSTSRASTPTWPCGGSTMPCTRRSPTRSRRSPRAFRPLTLLLVNGRPAVADGHLAGPGEDTIAREASAQSRRLFARAR